MGKQEIAVLEWYLAMGIDEVVEETSQNRLVAPQPLASGQWSEAKELKPSIAPSSQSSYIPPSEALEKTQALAKQVNTLAELRECVLHFKDLSICKTATQGVFAQGVESAPLMVIGEAPGADEDRSGVPFCGVSGQLLDKMLVAIQHSRNENAYITNAVFWRPPGNRTPTPEEIAICQPFVFKHIDLIKPKVILLMGAVAARSVLGDTASIARLRGKPLEYNGIPVVVSYHPSYLLRQPSQKRLAWEDLLRVKALLAQEA